MSRAQSGFTLIELISVMVLIGILATVAFSRFADTGLYQQALFIDKLQAYLRLTQQIAMAQTEPADTSGKLTEVTASFNLRQLTQSQWQVTITNSSGERQYQLQSDTQLLINEQILASGTNFSLGFDAQGDLITSNFPKPFTLTQSIAMAAGSQVFCITPTGFSYEGACI
ncbi:MAG: hypothetical protein OFPI_33350 [Osedax symbiont Rs2]|nr:MAG: hypothetical protein OFPI_33350 [Osedax symbiont Rs2]